MRPCENCATEELSAFYETQASAYCKKCHKERYFVPGRQRLLASKLARGECVDCKMTVSPENACAFDFDHVRDKKHNVSAMITMCDRKFQEEVDKCELRCANCHRIATNSRPRVQPYPGRPRKILTWAPLT